MFSENGEQYWDLQNLLPNFMNIQHSLTFPKPKKLFITKYSEPIRFFNSPAQAKGGSRLEEGLADCRVKLEDDGEVARGRERSVKIKLKIKKNIFWK